MTSLLPNQSEQQFITNSINEALELYGQQTMFYSRENYSLYLDNNHLDNGTTLKVLLQSNPQRKLLNNLGWYREDDEEQNMIMFAPFKINETLVHIKLGDVFVFDNGGMILMARKVNRNYFYGLWNIVSVVPYEKDNAKLANTLNKNADKSKAEAVEETHIRTPFKPVSDDEFNNRSSKVDDIRVRRSDFPYNKKY